MWMSLAVITALSVAPGQAGQLSITNARFTYGVLGPTRTDAHFLPGDEAVLSFDIEGAQADDEGRVQTTVGLEVLDKDGHVRFKQKPHDLDADKSLGGDSVQGVARLDVGLDQPPGEYTLKITVTDRRARTRAVLTKTAEVLPADFGVVRLHATTDADGRVAASAWGVGQSAWINALCVGFARDGGQPHVVAELRVLDENGRPANAKPYVGEIQKDVPNNARVLPLQFLLELNRAGSFTVELTVTDKVSGKKTTGRLPLSVAKPS